jgi:hypothetical protein
MIVEMSRLRLSFLPPSDCESQELVRVQHNAALRDNARNDAWRKIPGYIRNRSNRTRLFCNTPGVWQK